jgi:uncharacterized protein
MLAHVSDDLVESLPISDHTDRFVSELLGLRCRLVYLPVNLCARWTRHTGGFGDQVGLADGFPFLLIAEASSPT